MLSKLNLSFLFSLFHSNMEIIDTKMYLYPLGCAVVRHHPHHRVADNNDVGIWLRMMLLYKAGERGLTLAMLRFKWF